MKRSVRIVCTPAVAAGFGLAGVSVIEATDSSEGVRRIADLREREDVGVVLVEDVLYEALPTEARSGRRNRPLPIVVPFPGPHWDERSSAEQYVVEILRRAIGYHVRMR